MPASTLIVTGDVPSHPLANAHVLKFKFVWFDEITKDPSPPVTGVKKAFRAANITAYTLG
jgi:hypothetical protein